VRARQSSPCVPQICLLPLPCARQICLLLLPARALSRALSPSSQLLPAPYARARLLLTALGARAAAALLWARLAALCSGRSWLLSALGAASCCSLGALLLLWGLVTWLLSALGSGHGWLLLSGRAAAALLWGLGARLLSALGSGRGWMLAAALCSRVWLLGIL
jgi:hypothetical protein